jgi:hypothetical protein
MALKRPDDQGLSGGAEGNRTPDLFHAMEALYQLSYSPGRPVDDTNRALSDQRTLRPQAVQSTTGASRYSRSIS